MEDASSQAPDQRDEPRLTAVLATWFEPAALAGEIVEGRVGVFDPLQNILIILLL